MIVRQHRFELSVFPHPALVEPDGRVAVAAGISMAREDDDARSGHEIAESGVSALRKLRIRGTETFVAVSVGKAFHVYNVSCFLPARLPPPRRDADRPAAGHRSAPFDPAVRGGQ